jgi:hypothetical protein
MQRPLMSKTFVSFPKRIYLRSFALSIQTQNNRSNLRILSIVPGSKLYSLPIKFKYSFVSTSYIAASSEI